MPDTATLEAAKEAVQRPDSFALFRDGDKFTRDDMFVSWGLCGPCTHRDADALTESNYHCIKKELETKFPEDIEEVGSSHWAVGWTDQLAVRVFDAAGKVTEAFTALMEIRDALADYPVFDDCDFSDREHDRAIETLTNCYELGGKSPADVLAVLSDQYGYNLDDCTTETIETAIAEA